MSYAGIYFAGLTSTDTDYVEETSRRQQLMDATWLRQWFINTDDDVSLSGTDPTKLLALIDRKGVGNASAVGTSDATRPGYATSSSYGDKYVTTFTAGANRALSVASTDFSGSAFSVVALVERQSVNATNGDTVFWSGAGSAEVHLKATASGNYFQMTARGSTINIAAKSAPDTTPLLIIGSWSGNTVRGAIGSLGATTTASTSGSALAASSPADIGYRPSSPTTYCGGNIAQVMLCSSDVLASGNEAQRALIAAYLTEYYGVSV